MLTVISSTNRKNSEALRFARLYRRLLLEHTREEVRLLALENIPHDWFHPLMYEREHQTKSLIALQDRYLLQARGFVFIVPEYNGGVPGALKLFIDACSVRDWQKTYSGKKAALVGIATGRAGNLRGMDHLTGILNHLGVHILPNKLPLSSIERLIDDEGQISDPPTLQALEQQVRQFLEFLGDA
ncbi:MAG: NAD(P)H-dependent oxidoreductase [Bacteroidetes bacterium]|nr:MAG: NAD(P)H-dependent oxidoreductase [Bacteroidota bacterium]